MVLNKSFNNNKYVVKNYRNYAWRPSELDILTKTNNYRIWLQRNEKEVFKKQRENIQKFSEDLDIVLSGDTKDVNFNKDINNLYEKLKDLNNLRLKHEQMFNNCVELSKGIIDKYGGTNNDNTIYNIIDKKITPVKLLSYMENKREDIYYNSDALLSIIKDFTTEDEELKKKLDLYSNVLDEFKESLDSLDTIELSRYSKSIITEEKFLINITLWNYLQYGHIHRLYNSLRKTKDGSLYVVVFNKLKNKKDGKYTLIYNYRKYSSIFIESLLLYFIKENKDSFLSDNFTIGSGLLFFIQDELLKEYNLHNIDMRIEPVYLNTNTKNYLINKPKHIIDIFKLIMDQNTAGVSIDKMVDIIKHSDLNYEKNYEKLIEILSEEGKFHLNKKMFYGIHNRLVEKKIYNTLTRFIFVVNDLESLKNILKSLGFKDVNEGSQSFRGCGSYINKIATALDDDWRECLYRHYLFFEKNHQVSQGRKHLSYSKFSYKNIHINLGYDRWYSTATVGWDKRSLSSTSHVLNSEAV